MSEHRKRVGLGGVVALAVVLGWWAWSRDAAPSAMPPTMAPAAAAPSPEAAALPVAKTPARRAEVPDATTPPAAAPRLAHVRGRCVDEAGAPLAGCTARLDGSGRNATSMAMQGAVDWQDPEPIATAADGVFDIAFVPPSGFQWGLDVQADGRVPRTGRWGRIEVEQVIDLGDVRMLRGFEVRGRVVDEQGVPVAKVGVALHGLPLPLAPGMAANDTRYGWSAADGSFRVEVPIPIGTWPIAADARGIRHVSPDQVTVTERGAEPVLVTVRRMPSIEGVVVDESGRPVEGVLVQAVPQRSPRMASGRSRGDGTFTIHAVDAEPLPVKLRIDDPGPCQPPAVDDEREWPWGSRDARFELPRALACDLVVVERGSGVPVTRYAVRCFSERARSSLQTDLRGSGDHPDGRLTIDRIWRGRTFLQVVPLDAALRPSEQIELLVGDTGAPPQRVEIERLQPAVVKVARADGTAVSRSRVEVVLVGSEPFDERAATDDVRGGMRSFSNATNFRAHALLSAANTGADGRAAVFVLGPPAHLAVRVKGSHATAIVDPVRFVAAEDLVVVLTSSGSIVGRVRLHGLDPARIRIAPVDVAARHGPLHGQEVSVQGDGSFACLGIAPGRYRMRLTYSVPFRRETSSIGGQAPFDVPHDEVVVAAGQDTRVEFDASAFAPATVRGRVLVDGVPPPSVRVFLQQENGATFGQYVPAADGTFVAEGLLPGTYRAGLVVDDVVAGPGDTILADHTVPLAARQQFDGVFAFARRRLVVTVLQADGAAVANLPCMLSDGRHGAIRRTTDASGRMVLDPAPSAPLHVFLAATGLRLGTVQIPPGQTLHEVTLTLPK